MKISKLHIDSFRHLENLDFDFTYPKDFHIVEKRGKPLDKICFIGQSATGKTGLLELIYEYTISTINTELAGGFLTDFRNKVTNSNATFQFLINDKVLIHKNNEIEYENKSYKVANVGGEVRKLLPYNDKKNILYFKSTLISNENISFLTKNPIELIEQYDSHLKSFKNVKKFSFDDFESHSFVFDDKIKPEIFVFLLFEKLIYRKNFTQKMSEIIYKGLLADTKKMTSEFQKWQKENPNALDNFAKKFNVILKRLNLEVDLINTAYSIPIKNINSDEVFPFEDTSNGTKQLLLTSIPLFNLDTKDSIILIDEPERSLYPDMQMDLMEYYQNLAPEAQFIVATHSPFIAASFEPEERFILYFDEEGKVAVRRGISPIGDDPNDMLKNDFGVNYYNSFGEAAYKNYLKLKEDLAKEKDPTKKKKLLLETVQLGDIYNF